MTCSRHEPMRVFETMNTTTVSPGADSAFAATIRDCAKKPGRFARPYARKLWVWLKRQGAGEIDLGVLGRGKTVYQFEPEGLFVKLVVRDDPDYGFDPKKEGIDDCSDIDLKVVDEAISSGVLDPNGPEHAECMKLLGMEVKP